MSLSNFVYAVESDVKAFLTSDAFKKFARDLVEGAIAGGIVGVLALNLDTASSKNVTQAFEYGFISAAIAIARRYVVDALKSS